MNARGRDERQALSQFQGRMPLLSGPIELRRVKAIDERIVGHLLEALQAQSALRDSSKLPHPAGFQTAGGCQTNSASLR
jgi:hypothetical protein